MSTTVNEFLSMKDKIDNGDVVSITFLDMMWITGKYIIIGSFMYLVHLVIEVSIGVYILKFIGIL